MKAQNPTPSNGTSSNVTHTAKLVCAHVAVLAQIRQVSKSLNMRLYETLTIRGNTNNRFNPVF